MILEAQPTMNVISGERQGSTSLNQNQKYAVFRATPHWMIKEKSVKMKLSELGWQKLEMLNSWPTVSKACEAVF